MVMQRADGESSVARDALGELAQRYLYPVYAYMRCGGHEPSVAEDLTRGVLQRLLQYDRLVQKQTSVGHYRLFLLDRLRSFASRDWGKVIEEEAPVLDVALPEDLEARYQHDKFGAASPEQAFQRSFALVILQRSLKRLCSEAEQTGHLDMYKALEPYLARDPSASQYEAMAARLNIRQLTLVLALKRLRQRLREMAAEELSDTVTTADDLAREQDALLAVLGELGS
jgi:RNA polymerase sigma-70 factor (ECF subfamily)